MKSLKHGLLALVMFFTVVGVGVTVANLPAFAEPPDPCSYATYHESFYTWESVEGIGPVTPIGSAVADVTMEYGVTFETTVLAAVTVGASIGVDALVSISATVSATAQWTLAVGSSSKATVTTKPGQFFRMQNIVLWRHVNKRTAWIADVPGGPFPQGKTCYGTTVEQGKAPEGTGICVYGVTSSPEKDCKGAVHPGSSSGGGAPGGVTTPTGPQPVTTVNGLADGTVLATSDTKRIYKMVGGAPVWQATCDGGICQPQARPTTQSVINAGPATPRNGSTAIDQRGHVYVFVGGAPLWQESCGAPVTCGTPVKVSDWSIDARDHMNVRVADGQLVQARSSAGDLPVAVTVGGALVAFANPQEVVDSGYGADWAGRVTAISAGSYTSLGFELGDGILVQGAAGGVSTPVAMTVGGAMVPFANPQEVIDAGFGSDWSGKVRGIPTRAFDARLGPLREGTLVQGTGGGSSTPVAAILKGGSRLNFASAQELVDTGYGADWASRVRAIPTRAFNELSDRIPDETLIQGVAGGSTTPLALTAGGARIQITNLQQVIDIGFGADWESHITLIPSRAYSQLSDVPADGTVLRSTDQLLYTVIGGEAAVIGDCPASDRCARSIKVTNEMVAGKADIAASAADWVDVSGDGKLDYCRRVGTENLVSSRVSCTLSTGTGFGTTIVSGIVDWGYAAGRKWVDVTGDGKADFCRVRGTANQSNSVATCTPSTGTGFGPDINSSNTLDWGYPAGRTWADANGDGKADFCRRIGTGNLVGSRVSCTLSTGTGFGTTIVSGVVDWGFPAGTAWVDVTGDGKADFCRVRGTANQTNSVATCTPSTGTGFGSDINSSNTLDWGYPAGRTWADANGDGKADFCRRIGTDNLVGSRVSCTLSTGTGFGTTIVSGIVDWGFPAGRKWMDVTGDGKADFCRVRGTANQSNSMATCTPSTGTGFGSDINSVNILDWGYPSGRGWADANGDGKADYCRRIGTGNLTNSRLACSPSTGTGFAPTIVSEVVDWGYVD
jgi:hypothetical protein